MSTLSLLIIALALPINYVVATCIAAQVNEVYSGLRAQERILQNGQYMGEQLIPFPEELQCNMCSTNHQCKKDCDYFYQLMLATIKAHDQAKKLQGSNNQLLQDLNPILEGQIKQLCDLLTAEVGADRMECDITQLMKMRVKLEELFTARDTIAAIKEQYPRPIRTNLHRKWTECNLACDNTLLAVIQSVYINASCSTSCSYS